MIRTLRWLLVVAAAIALTSCGGVRRLIFGPAGPAIERYKLVMPAVDDGTSRGTGPAALAGGLAIAPYITRGIYDEPGIVFRINDLQLQSYPSREWAIPLGDMLGAATETMLHTSPLTADPADFDPRSRRSHRYNWRGTVREFEEVNRARSVLVAVHVEAEIVLAANDSVVWTGSERIERAVPEPTNSMTRVVETLSSVTADVLSALIQRARAELGASSAEPPPPPPS